MSEPSALDDTPPRAQAGRPLWWVAGLVVCALLALAAWLVLDDGREATLREGKDDVQGEREERLGILLESLAAQLGHGVDGLAAPGGATDLAAVDQNVRRIGFSHLSLRYVAPAIQSGQQLMPEDTWVADVQVTWRFRTYDPAQSTLEVPFVIVDDGGSALFGGISAGEPGERVPPWLLERLAVRKGDRTLVLAGSPKRLPQLDRLARDAVPAVDKVLPDWRGSLVLVEPSSNPLLNRAVGADPATTGQLAGVTTTVDGTVVRGATSHVLLNPDVFDGLGPQAAQIVVTHEATHVATDGAVSSMPQWLVEGFADYVALRDLGLPIAVSASQILADVRRDGPPAKLPTSADFGGQNVKLGAMYESAWLATQLIAEQHGEDSLVRLYEEADAEGGTGRAFRSVLGTTEAAFTRSWRDYLAQLASGS